MRREPKASIVHPAGMKKLFLSLGMAAAGTAGLHASDLLTMDDNKVWNVSATLRGFYDDNYVTSAKKIDSVGFEVSPSFQLEKPFQQTELGVKYVYGLMYYERRAELHQNPI